jgi:hypothetical protein
MILRRQICAAATAVTALGLPLGCLADEMSSQGVPVAPFSEASLILEHNATDGDAEIVAFVKGGDEGLARLRVLAPDNNTLVMEVSTQERVVGLREVMVESAEPGMAELVGAYPAGSYRIEGVTISGKALHSTVSLSHDLPSRPTLEVDPAGKTIAWSSVQGATKISIELEREVDGEDEMELTMDLPMSAKSFAIPEAFRRAGDYQVGLAVTGSNGNVVVVEKEFAIEP